MIIPSMSALQLHPLLIHNLLIPQVRLRHAQKCMLHSSRHTYARARQWHCGHRLVSAYFDGRKHIIPKHLVIELQTYEWYMRALHPCARSI